MKCMSPLLHVWGGGWGGGKWAGILVGKERERSTKLKIKEHTTWGQSKGLFC